MIAPDTYCLINVIIIIFFLHLPLPSEGGWNGKMVKRYLLQRLWQCHYQNFYIVLRVDNLLGRSSDKRCLELTVAPP